MARRLERTAAICVLATLVAGSTPPAPIAAVSRNEASAPIVTIVRHGGLCVSGTECRSVLRISDTSVAGAGYVARPLSARERAALLQAIDRLDIAVLRKHPFRGTCPTAYDGMESLYRFRGFAY